MRRTRVVAGVAAFCFCTLATGWAQPVAGGGHPDVRLFFQAIHDDGDVADAALEQIAARWRNGYAGIIWDLVRFMRPPRRPPIRPPSLGADLADRAPAGNCNGESPSIRAHVCGAG